MQTHSLHYEATIAMWEKQLSFVAHNYLASPKRNDGMFEKE